MGQALYRKYRSKRLSEIVGQEHITTTLNNALKSGKLSHAYLFTGPRGVGKTSIARILAHEINQLPYDDDTTHMDIIEIDAASNRRIDEIRELRDKVHVAPTSAKYKVYIIDEVHMLTKEAFNALLKTLEEPPAHVIFILATTDVHKLPETIISRTQRFSFKAGDPKQMAAHLKTIATAEGLTASDEAFELLAEHGDGSFRDSISLLDQASNHSSDLTAADVRALLGIPPSDAIEQLANALSSHTASNHTIQELNSLYEQGYPAAGIAKQLGAELRAQALNGSRASVLPILRQLLDVPTAHDPERFLEILVLEALDGAETPPEPLQLKTKAKSAPAREIAAPTVAESEKASEPQAAAPKAAHDITEAKPSASGVLDEAVWPQVLAALKKEYNTLYGVVRMAQPTFEDNTLHLTFGFAFHQKRVSEAKNRQIISDVIKQVTGLDVQIECSFQKGTPASDVKAAAAEAVDISSISNIFGGGELLES